MSNKICKDEQLELSFNFSNQSIKNPKDKRIADFNEYRNKKDKDFFLSTVDYLIKHLHE